VNDWQQTPELSSSQGRGGHLAPEAAADLKAPFPDAKPVRKNGQMVPGYWVRPDGTVWSQWEGINRGSGWEWHIAPTARKLKPYRATRSRMYLCVDLMRGGRKLKCYVHTLVAEAFIGARPARQQVCHNDGNSLNNAAGNLRYDTAAGNQADKIAHGTHQYGQRNPSAKLTDAQAEDIRRLRAGGVKLRDIAERFGVRESTVSRIANGVRRGHTC